MKKLLQFPVIRIVIVILMIAFAVAVGQIVLSLLRSALSITEPAIANLLAFALITPLAYFAYSLYVHRIEKREMTELGSSKAWREFGIGALLGFGLFSLIIILLWLLGYYQVTSFEFVFLTLLGTLFGAFTSAWVQELIFRAALYRITEQWLGTWWALGISALLFGLLHLSSAGATLFSALAVALQAGILLGAAYCLTHRLWMVLGIHMAWDFANDGIYGVGVSGQTGEGIQGLFHANLVGPEMITGGIFGVEASVITLIVMLLAGIFVLWMADRKGQFVSRKKQVTAIPQ